MTGDLCQIALSRPWAGVATIWRGVRAAFAFAACYALRRSLLATGAGALALVGIILSAGMITNSRSAAARGADFARQNGFITLVLFGTYSLALWLLQVLLLQFFPPQTRLTAFNPGYLTYL